MPYMVTGDADRPNRTTGRRLPIPLLLAEQLPELGDHARPPHRPAAGIRQLTHVDGSGHVGVPVTEQERDLIDSLAGQECPTRDGVAEAVHRGQLTVSDRQELATLALPVKRREGRGAFFVDGVALGNSQGSSDVPLPERPTGLRSEYEVVGLVERAHEFVPDEHECKLPRNRHRPRGSVRLGRSALAVPVDLPRELNLGVIDVIEPNVCPGQSKQLRDARARECREREEGSPRLLRRCDRLLELSALEDPAPL
jgi:hypothetical protein